MPHRIPGRAQQTAGPELIVVHMDLLHWTHGFAIHPCAWEILTSSSSTYNRMVATVRSMFDSYDESMQGILRRSGAIQRALAALGALRSTRVSFDRPRKYLARICKAFFNVPQACRPGVVSSSVSRPLFEEVWSSTSSVTYHLRGYSKTHYIIYNDAFQGYLILKCKYL